MPNRKNFTDSINRNNGAGFEFRHTEIEHGVMVGTDDDHIVGPVRALMLATQGTDVMDLRVELVHAELDTFVTYLATIIVKRFEPPGFHCISNNSGYLK